jgi:uncharacterized protein YbjQ (UPF0145 family)
MLKTTTNTLEGVAIKQYLGIVSGEAILGANLVKDLFASVRDIVGGRSGAYEAELVRAKETAMHEMEAAALAMGANAIIGVDLDYESLGSGGSMLMVCASGTAVLIQYTTHAV